MNFVSWDIDRLDEVVTLWNKELGDEFPLRHQLMKQNSFEDENICKKSSIIVVDKANKIIGFAVAKRWKENFNIGIKSNTGWIQVLLVDSGHRNKGIGTKILNHIESSLKSRGVKEIFLGSDPWHYFPGIPEQSKKTIKWFQKKGYKNQGKVYDMICEYNPEETSYQLPTFKDATFYMLEKNEEVEFLQFLNRCFPGRWEYEAMHYFQKGGTGREFIVLKKNDRIIGFSRLNDTHSPFIAQNTYWAPLFNGHLGGVGPLGIDPSEQKQGYGLAIVQAAITTLRKRNIDRIIIDWTNLTEFYSKLGFKNWKGYITSKKNLDE